MKIQGQLFNILLAEKNHFHTEAEHDQFLLRIRTIFLYTYSILASISYSIIIYQTIRDNNNIWLVYVFAACAGVLIANLIYYRSRKYLDQSTNILLFIIAIVIIIGLYVEHPLLGGIIWIMPFPLYVFFLKGFRIGIRWLLAAFVLFAGLVLGTRPHILFIETPTNYLLIYFLLTLGIGLTLFFIDRRQSENTKYELIARHTQDVIIFWDSSLRIIYASPSAANYAGQESEKLIGKNALDFIHPNDRAKVARATRTALRYIEFRIITPKGGNIWFEGRIEPVTLLGQDQSITLMTARDITKRHNFEKEVERAYLDARKFKQAVENTSEHIVITDADGIIIYANSAVARITGYQPEEILGKKAGKAWGGLMGNDFYRRFWHTIKEEKRTFTGKIQNQRKNKEKYFALLSVSPILNHQKNVIGFIGIERDITHEVEVDNAKTEFVSLASHQLRTPLSAINWYTEILLSGEAGRLSRQQKDYLREIADGSHRMVDLVNALLNVSRLELGTFMVEPEPTDVAALSRDVVTELRPTITQKKLKVTETYARLPKLNVDPKLTRIILQNLTSNAVKYTPAKGAVSVSIRATHKQTTAAGQKVPRGSMLITVKDTGMGIPHAQQNNIFQKLYRADNAKSSDTEGTGLGLYIVKAILDQSGGKIWFTSAENKGTTVYACLPLSGMKAKKGTKALS